MAFNNPLGFNVSKAIPTTSTTNANTTSTVSSQVARSPSPARLSELDQHTTSSISGWKDLQESLRPPSSSARSSPKILQPTIATGLSDVTPTTVSVAEGANNSGEKPDLIGLFDKFDVNKENDNEVSKGDDDEIEVDSLEEKMRQFKPKARQNSNMSSSTDRIEEKVEPTAEKSNPNTLDEQDETIEDETPKDSEIVDTNASVPEQSNQAEEDNLQSASETHDDQQAEQVEGESTEPQPDVDSNQDSSLSSELAFKESNDDDLLKGTQLETVEDYQLKDDDLPDQTSNSSSAPVRPRQKRNNSIQRTLETVNPQSQYQRSHRPFDFQTFLSHIKKRSADPLVRYIRSFLVSFTRQAPAMDTAQKVKAVRQFKDFIKVKFQEYEPFASMDQVDIENSNEGIEKLIMNRLYEYCFSPEVFNKFGARTPESHLKDMREDVKFASYLDKFSWVLGTHLDVDLDEIAQRKKETSHDSMNYLDHAITELNKMNNYRAPRDKIICILNSCKIIFSLLRVSKQETNADAFIPLLILVIIRAKTPNIMSNIHYIERFRGQEWLMHGETSYYLSSIQGAISFIQNITKDDLTVSEGEYLANLEAWEADMKQRPPTLVIPEPRPASNNAEGASIVRQNLSPSSVLIASAESFKNSITSYLTSPSPQAPEETAQTPQATEAAPGPSEEDINTAFEQLTEMFPSLDKAILRDLIIMNDANIEKTLDVCLQLVNES